MSRTYYLLQTVQTVLCHITTRGLFRVVRQLPFNLFFFVSSKLIQLSYSEKYLYHESRIPNKYYKLLTF